MENGSDAACMDVTSCVCEDWSCMQPAASNVCVVPDILSPHSSMWGRCTCIGGSGLYCVIFPVF